MNASLIRPTHCISRYSSLKLPVMKTFSSLYSRDSVRKTKTTPRFILAWWWGSLVNLWNSCFSNLMAIIEIHFLFFFYLFIRGFLFLFFSFHHLYICLCTTLLSFLVFISIRLHDDFKIKHLFLSSKSILEKFSTRFLNEIFLTNGSCLWQSRQWRLSVDNVLKSLRNVRELEE